MSIRLMVKAVQTHVDNALRKLVLIELAYGANDDGECWMSHQDIANRCAISRRSVINHISALEKSGLIIKQYRFNSFNGSESNIYVMRFGDSDSTLIRSSSRKSLARVKNNYLKKRRSAISKATRNQVFDLLGNRCLGCGSYDEICIDHVVPLVGGGSSSIDNMQPLCRTCNSEKGVDSTDYRKELGA